MMRKLYKRYRNYVEKFKAAFEGNTHTHNLYFIEIKYMIASSGIVVGWGILIKPERLEVDSRLGHWSL